MATDDYWLDTGRPELYLQANLDVLGGRRRHDACEAIAPGAVVDPTASVVDTIVAGTARLGAGSVVERSVVLDGAVIADGAQVTDSVVMGRVEAGAVVSSSVIGAPAYRGSVAAMSAPRSTCSRWANCPKARIARVAFAESTCA